MDVRHVGCTRRSVGMGRRRAAIVCTALLVGCGPVVAAPPETAVQPAPVDRPRFREPAHPMIELLRRLPTATPEGSARVFAEHLRWLTHGCAGASVRVVDATVEADFGSDCAEAAGSLSASFHRDASTARWV